MWCGMSELVFWLFFFFFLSSDSAKIMIKAATMLGLCYTSVSDPFRVISKKPLSENTLCIQTSSDSDNLDFTSFTLV